MDIYKEVNKQKGANFNGSGNNNDPKYSSRTGVVIPNRVFVGGICPTATENDLLNLFGKYGSVKGIKIVIDQNGSSKGYGFVTFDKADDALRLKNDANNVIFNERRLNIAPAVMKNPPLLNRYTDSYVVPVTPNLYFTNNLPYQYQEGTSLYTNTPYVPPVTVGPTLTDPTYYHQNNYAVPAATYQGAALFYPIPTNTSSVMLGHQPYQHTQTNNSNYMHSSPARTTSSPVNSNIKITNPMTTIAGSSEMHASLCTAIIPAPTNVSSLPLSLPYQMAHPTHFYNNSIMPPYTGEIYYSMMNNAFYPMVNVTGHETFIPYYELNESYNSNIAEEPSCESANNFHPINVPLSNVSEVNSCESSPTSTTNNNDCKTALSVGPPPNTDHFRDNSYSPENVPPVTATPVSSEAPIIQSRYSSSEFNSSTYMQHQGGTLIYPNTQVPQQNVYFNSMYVADMANGSFNQCPYSKSLSEHFVSDHLPKRDAKYPPKKYVPPPVKDIPPNIPKFPFYMNNNYPGFVNRNVKDFKNTNGKNIDVKQSQRTVRNLPNGNNMLAKPRIFHNQNQYGGNPSLKNDRNGHVIQSNGQYLRHNSGRTSRTPYDQIASTNSYYYPMYVKNTSCDGYRKSGPNNYGSNRSRYEKVSRTMNEMSYSNNIGEHPKMYSTQEERHKPSNEEPILLEQKTLPMTENLENQESQICDGVQTLTL